MSTAASPSALSTCSATAVPSAPEEAEDYLKMGVLNGLFVLGRSIGLIAHYLDQKRLRTGLYRHPWDDITYLLPSLGQTGQPGAEEAVWRCLALI